MQSAHLNALETKHATLDRQIAAETQRPSPDQALLSSLKKRKLISKIEAALRRIDDGEYGYCEVTGEPIALGRLEARPIATMTVEAQERHERNEKVSREE